MKMIVLLFFIGMPVFLFAEDGQKLTMSLAYVADSGVEKQKYVIVINGSLAFISTEGFMEYVGKLPAGTELTWAPGCCRTGNEPFLSSEVDMGKLQKFLSDRKVKFVLVPSG